MCEEKFEFPEHLLTPSDEMLTFVSSSRDLADYISANGTHVEVTRQRIQVGIYKETVC